ncbi:MAG TPA: radical SAM domain-containing protein, partial [Thermoanaerobaculia bacterium]|nr:radical SAM domain-containing protein [Thermoanaerobaculia bacterium]
LLGAAIFTELAEAGVRDYQISLDGPQAIHDQTRVMANGKGTFERIWENLLAIKRTSFEAKITLRLHFDAETAFTMEPLLDALRRDFLDDPRFVVFFKSIERLGGPADEKIKILNEDEKQQAVDHLRQQLFGEAAPPPAESEGYVCYASRPNSLLIRADGRIGKCTVALNDDRNTIGRLRPDGTLELDQSRIRPWLRGLETMDPEILGCPLAGLP